jgi:hypothetical protein
VQHHADDQDDPDGPEDFANGAKKVAVRIDLRGALEHLEIAGQMPDDEEEQDRPGHSHHGFFAIRGLPETRCAVFARASDRCAHCGCPAKLVWITSDRSFSIRMLGLFKANLYYWCGEEAASTVRGSR